MPVLEEIPFAEFVAIRSPRLLHLAYLLTRDRGRAEDLVQTALARAWPAWGRITDPEAYVRRIMLTTYAAWWRRRWNGEVPTDRLPEPAAADQHSRVDEREEMMAALRRLPRQQRAVLILRYYEDLSDADIAETLGVSAGTVRSHAAKALAALRVDVVLAASVLQSPAGVPPVVLAAVMSRVSRQRRRRIAAIATACVMLLIVLLGYALTPHRRTVPPTDPSPRPRSTMFAPFSEYEGGTRMLDRQDLVPGRTATFRWTPNGQPVHLRFTCDLSEPAVILRFSLRLNGGQVWEDGGCTTSYGTLAVLVSVERQTQAGLVHGVIELSVSLAEVALDGNESDRSHRATPVPADSRVNVGLAIAVPWEEYSFPPRPIPSSPDPTRQALFGKPWIASALDPTQPRSGTFTWNEPIVVGVRTGAPIELDVFVDERLLTTCRSWTYAEFGCTFDLGPTNLAASTGISPGTGAQVTVTVVPRHATDPWAMFLMGKASPSR